MPIRKMLWALLPQNFKFGYILKSLSSINRMELIIVIVF